MINLSYIEVYGEVSFPVNSTGVTVDRNVTWLGGPGKLVIQGVSATGSACLVNTGVLITDPIAGIFAIGDLIPGISTFLADGVYDFIAPPCICLFRLQCPAGDSITLQKVFFAKI